jgi:hypothetical protein
LYWNQIKHYPIYVINASQFGCKPNEITILPKFWKGNGYDPINVIFTKNLGAPLIWSCQNFGRPYLGSKKKHALVPTFSDRGHIRAPNVCIQDQRPMYASSMAIEALNE